MKKLYKVALLVIGLACTSQANAQNQTSISQYMLYQPFLNPAALSTYNDFSFGLLHRNQWAGFNNAPTTSMISVNTPIRTSGLSVGLGYQGEEIGVLTSNALFANFNYKFQVDKGSYISAGISLGVDMFQMDYSKLINSDEDPELGYGANTKNLLNPLGRFGINYFNENFYVTAYIPNILKPEISGSGDEFDVVSKVDFKDWHYYAQAGYNLEMSRTWDANFSTLVKVSSKVQYDLNAQLVYNKILGFGLSYRVNSAVAGLVNVTLSKKVKLGYSYDFATNGLSNVQTGSHEVIAIFDLNREFYRARIQVPRF